MERKHEDVDWFFCEVSRIVTFLRSSNKRQALLRNKQVAHFANLIEKELVEIVFKDLESDSHSKGEPKSLLLVMQTFVFVVMLHLMVEILSLTNNLSQSLQKGDQDIVHAMELVQICKKKLQEFRDGGWETLYEQVVASCGNVEIDVPDMESRYVKDKKSKRLAPFVTNFHYFKNDCFLHVIDVVLKELNDRFTPENTELINCVACLSPCYSFESFDAESLMRLARFYPNDFEDLTDKELSSELKTYIESVKMDDHFSNLTGISELCRTLVEQRSIRHLGMKYVKNELRSRMANSWLNDCLVKFVEKGVFDTIDDMGIIKRFQGMNKRRMHLRLH
ncbi:uncharacterized protein LOC131613369 [Vicia villosa]|uniref:uncharacterized protein LOC131613369 n=1 Tax=Vicia villosa TaxID=3911 RepID=UPI00273C426D|nr:uncharacterized protein LOC131613369 [Vicia villosa]